MERIEIDSMDGQIGPSGHAPIVLLPAMWEAVKAAGYDMRDYVLAERMRPIGSFEG